MSIRIGSNQYPTGRTLSVEFDITCYEGITKTIKINQQ